MVLCPKCGSEKTAEILYGMPTLQAFEASERGEIILGGCMLNDDTIQPDYGCLECKYKWATSLLPATKITKFRYKVTQNGPCTIEDQERWVYEIYPAGKCIKYSYRGRNKKYAKKEVVYVGKRRVYQLACSIQKILGVPLWMRNIVEAKVCDGCSYNLQITYADNRKEELFGDVGGGTFDTLAEEFVKGMFKS
ncbi:MAG: hypothetical protein K1W28_12275 [Lachnospiraceae bacterium]